MRVLVLLSALSLITAAPALGQSGRRAKDIKIATPVEQPTPQPDPTPRREEPASQVTAEKNEEYKCTDDGSLVRIVEAENQEPIFAPKQVDKRAEILKKPNPSYTREARRYGVQGYVILKVVLSATGEIGRVKVVRRLPAGLTENAIRAACKIEFKPALKNGSAVAQSLQVEYTFRLADSSIFGP